MNKIAYNCNFIREIELFEKKVSHYVWVSESRSFWYHIHPAGWYYDGYKLSEEELKEQFLVLDNVLYIKPRAHIWLHRGGRETIYFDSYCDAENFLEKIVQSNPNIVIV